MRVVLRLIRIEMERDAACRLVICGVVVRRWAGAEFSGWGTPAACLFTRTWE